MRHRDKAHRGLHHNCAAYYGPSSYIAHFAITFPIHIHERPSPRRRWPLYYSIRGEAEPSPITSRDSRRLEEKKKKENLSLRRSRASFSSGLVAVVDGGYTENKVLVTIIA